MTKEEFLQRLLLRCPITLDHAAVKLGCKNATDAFDRMGLEDKLFKIHSDLCMTWLSHFHEELEDGYAAGVFDGSFEICDDRPMLVELPGEKPFVSEREMLNPHEAHYARAYCEDVHGKIPHREKEAYNDLQKTGKMV
ncbi:hypothetical protein A3731_16090 [Roseovarius sp. HI0049]|nr:hypothetical protein A3731_16090 [Roseovarius sp. HI0049]